jgi:septal ring-binding cell division protein DamX
MDDQKSTVYVFDKKELLLLVLFFVVMSITCFVLGVRFGKQHTLSRVGVEKTDEAAINLVSEKEEEINKIIQQEEAAQNSSAETADGLNPEGKKKLDDQTFEKLKNEFEKLEADNFKLKKKAQEPNPDLESLKTESNTETSNNQDTNLTETNSNEAQDSLQPDESIVGKYTIQIGSFKKLSEAQDFADAFIIRDYRPIINEVDIGDNGKWYRVSLGAFDSIRQAKEYINQEQSLFSSQEYIITEIK